MASTPTSNYSSSPSPSPSPSQSPSTQYKSEWRRDDSPEYGPGLYDLPEWCRYDSPEGGRCYTLDPYSVESKDEMPDLVAPPLTEEDEDAFHSPPPPKPITQTLHQSRTEKRFKKMADIGKEIPANHIALGWIFLGIELRKSHVAQILRTGFNLKPSLEEVFEIQSQLATEFNNVMRLCQQNTGSGQLCFVSFMRDLLEIPELAMIRMRRILAECKCCAEHQSRRPLCQEKKRQPDYDMFAQPENDCKCVCRHFMRKLESALLGEYHLEVNGQLWERSLVSS